MSKARSKVDWSKLSPKEIWKAIQSAPDDVLGPWEYDPPHPQARDKKTRTYARYEVGDDHTTGVIVYGSGKRWTWWIHATAVNPFVKTLKAAKAAADKQLKKEGWRLA